MAPARLTSLATVSLNCAPLLCQWLTRSSCKRKRFLSFRNQRIVEADALDETAIATIARIRHHYIEKRTILRAAAGKTNDYHIKPLMSTAKGRGFYDISGTYCNPQKTRDPDYRCSSTSRTNLLPK